MHYENKPLDEKKTDISPSYFMGQWRYKIAEQRFFNAGSLMGSELKYTEILQMYQQAQSDANKIDNLI